jgi:hypothetical protein
MGPAAWAALYRTPERHIRATLTVENVGFTAFVPVEASSMAKLPDNRRPFDPAKAARDRAKQDTEIAPLTPQQRSVRKPGLRPLPPSRSGGEED